MLYADPLKQHSFELWTENEIGEMEPGVVSLVLSNSL